MDIEAINSSAASAESIPECSPDLVTEFKETLQNGGDKKQIIALFSKFFGEALVSRALPKGLPDQLDRKAAIKLLGAIGSLVTIDDIHAAFNELKNGNRERRILEFARLSYWELWWAKSAADLPSESFGYLLDLFRNPLQAIDSETPRSLGAEIEQNGLKKIDVLSYTYHDYLTKELSKSDPLRPEFYLAPHELLARKIAYLDPPLIRSGMLFRTFDPESKQVITYVLKESLQYKGLHGYLFEPLHGGNHPAQLIFRGTDCKESTYRDLDPTGIGKKVFDEHAKELKSKLTTMNGKHLVISGHSLGAVDAQRTAVLLTDPNSPLKFSSIKVFAFCSPKLDHATVSQWEENLKSLGSKKTKPYIELNFAYHESDIITLTEHASLASSPHYYVHRNYLVVKSNSGYMNTKLHHIEPFFKHGQFDFEVDNRTFSFIQSASEEELVACEEMLKAAQNTAPWYRNLKSYFIQVDHPEEIEKRLQQLQEKKEQLEQHQNEKNGSWLVWSAHHAVRYTLHLRAIASPIFRWIAGITEKQKEEQT